jgi:hypothetical protein
MCGFEKLPSTHSRLSSVIYTEITERGSMFGGDDVFSKCAVSFPPYPDWPIASSPNPVLLVRSTRDSI